MTATSTAAQAATFTAAAHRAAVDPAAAAALLDHITAMGIFGAGIATAQTAQDLAWEMDRLTVHADKAADALAKLAPHQDIAALRVLVTIVSHRLAQDEAPEVITNDILALV